MKKVLMFVVIGFLFVVGIAGCGEDKRTITGGIGLPEGWRADIKTIPDLLLNTLHVVDDVLYDNTN